MNIFGTVSGVGANVVLCGVHLPTCDGSLCCLSPWQQALHHRVAGPTSSQCGGHIRARLWPHDGLDGMSRWENTITHPHHT